MTDEKQEETPSMQVERKLQTGRKRMQELSESKPVWIPGKPSPYLDTQLFPERKQPYHK